MNLNDNELVTKKYKELLQMNRKEINIPVEETMNWKQFTEEKT